MHQPDIQHWLDTFFDFCHAARPVDATFIGAHEHDHALPDYSENGTGDALATMLDLLRRVPDMDDGRADDPQHRPPSDTGAHTAASRAAAADIAAIDLNLARGHLRIQIAEYESLHFHRGNPALYTGEAVFGVLSLFLTDYAPLQQRVASAIERLARIPLLLDQGRRNVRRAPIAWTERAMRECEGARAFLTEGVSHLLADCSHARMPSRLLTHFAQAAEQAARAFTAFGSWLETDLRRRSTAHEGCGPELFALLLREGHVLAVDAQDIEMSAEEQLADARRALAAAVAAAGVRDEAEALEQLASLHPPIDRYYARFQETWDDARRTAEEHDLVSWPDDPIRFVPRPPWTRASSPHLYFLSYRAPAAFHRPEMHETLVMPIESDMPPEQQIALLRATNDSVIRLNHVIHHAGIGHHVQNGHAYRCISRVGRIAAVDGASRIAMYCGGTMAEGWACYATDLMAEIGALSPLERVAHARSIVRICVRAIVDVRLHTGLLTVAGAASFYERHAGVERHAARAEAVRNSMFPGTALMYLIGRNAIHDLRGEMRARLGNRFTLRTFHDAVLSWGSVPVSIIAAGMRRPAAGDVES